jgi:precorrin-2 methylase
MNPLRRRWIGYLFVLGAACLQAPPDVASLGPVRDADTRAIRLLREADVVSAHDTRAAAQMLRNIVLPVTRSNERECAAVHPRHRNAIELASELCSLLEERTRRVERYAVALETDDVAGQLREVRAQREMENDFSELERKIARAAAQPASRGCARSP